MTKGIMRRGGAGEAPLRGGRQMHTNQGGKRQGRLLQPGGGGGKEKSLEAWGKMQRVSCTPGWGVGDRETLESLAENGKGLLQPCMER
jgi:hypothetical protein